MFFLNHTMRNHPSKNKLLRTTHRVFMDGLELIEYAGLLVIAFATTFAIAHEVQTMLHVNAVQLSDLLLMFLYLEVLAMVGIYFKTGKLPVRFPIYIAIVALARYLLIDVKTMSNERMMTLSFAMLVLGLAILVIRFGHSKYPYENEKDDGS
jgi:protein PsiE